MRITRVILVVWLAVLAGAVACSEDDTPGTAVEAFCAGLCRAADRCLGANNTCSSACSSSSGAEAFSVEGARNVGECMADIDCGSLADETAFNDFFQDCWQSSKRLVPVTEQVRSVCTSYVEASFECGALYSEVDCERDLRMFSNGILGQVDDCLASPDCKVLDACLTEVFGAP